MNSTHVTCVFHVFEENPGALFGSVASYGIGIIGSGIWIHGIWKDAVDPNRTWTIFKIVHSWTKILVSFYFQIYVCMFMLEDLGIKAIDLY